MRLFGHKHNWGNWSLPFERYSAYGFHQFRICKDCGLVDSKQTTGPDLNMGKNAVKAVHELIKEQP